MRYDSKLSAVEKEIADTVSRSKSILAGAEAEGRSPSDEERAELDAQLHAVDVLKEKKREIEADKALADRVDSLGASIRVEPQVKENTERLSIGEQFVKSEGYLRAKSAGFTGSWSTGGIETKANELYEGTYSSPGTGGALVLPDVQAGIQPILFQAPTVADLFAQGSTDSNTVSYLVESVATSGADGVAEGANKPPSILEFDRVDEQVRKIATTLPVSDEMLADAAQIAAYINSRLGLFVRMDEERQLLNGGGTTELDGLLGRIPDTTPDHIGVYSADAVAPQAADHIYHGLSIVRQDSFLEPDAIVIHPADWENLVLLKDGDENYMGGGPFLQGANQSMWGKRVIVTSAMSEGTALVGAFKQGAQIFRREGLRVEASNQHSDFFVKNMVMIRAEERLALAVYRPEAFATVDLNGATT